MDVYLFQKQTIAFMLPHLAGRQDHVKKFSNSWFSVENEVPSYVIISSMIKIQNRIQLNITK